MGSPKFPFPSTSQAPLSAKRPTDTTGGRQTTGIYGCLFSSNASLMDFAVPQDSRLWHAPGKPASAWQAEEEAAPRGLLQLPAITVGTLGAASPAGPRAPSARGAEPSRTARKCLATYKDYQEGTANANSWVTFCLDFLQHLELYFLKLLVHGCSTLNCRCVRDRRTQSVLRRNF